MRNVGAHSKDNSDWEKTLLPSTKPALKTEMIEEDAVGTTTPQLTSPVLGLENRRQLARGNVSGHLGGALRLPVLTGHVERCVPILVLQLQAGPFLHQILHHRCQVQVRGQVQRGLSITKETGSVTHSELRSTYHLFHYNQPMTAFFFKWLID